MNELEASFLRLYTEILLPNLAGGSLALESVSAGARPLQATYSEGRRAMVHQRVMELLTGLQKKVFDSVHPGKIVELFKLGDGKPPRLGVKASEVVDGFYSFPGFPRLVRAQVCRKAIARGVGEGLFGYTSGATPALGLDGTYQIPLSKVRHGLSVAEDEVDLETGFLMMPQSIPRPVATPPGGATVAVGAGVGAGPAGPQPGPTPTTGTGMALAPQKSVELTFRADRDKLYAAWPAVANLADQAGTVEITLRASSDKGFDKAKLQNGVIEPLREQDLIE